MPSNERSLDEWAYRLQGEYNSIRKPLWRAFMPKKTWTHTQRLLFANFYKWREQNPGPDGEKTGAGMVRFLDAWKSWAALQHGDERTTWATLLGQFVDDDGTSPPENPEMAIREVLKGLHKRAAMALLHKLMGELI